MHIMQAKASIHQSVVGSTSDFNKVLENTYSWVNSSLNAKSKENAENIARVIKENTGFPRWIPSNKVNPIHTKKKLKKPESFHSIMKIPLLLGQCIGLNPVSGILHHDMMKLRFRIKSLVFWYSIFLCLGPLAALILSIYRLSWQPGEYLLMEYIFFYGSVFLTCIIFIGIARMWPGLVKEASLTELGDPITDQTLKLKCSVTSGLIAAFAFLEHVLSLIQKYAELIDCFANEDQSLYEILIRRSFPWLFELDIPFSVPLGIILQIMNFILTMSWNYSDLFLICISFYLTSRFEQINKKILTARGKYLPSSFWRSSREKYNRACQLVQCFDEVFSPVIFVSCASNLFFICLQLYHTLGQGLKHGVPVEQCPNFPSGPFRGNERVVYLSFSLSLLILRSIAVSLVAARVHSATLVPTTTLYAVPSPVYCIEVQRFLDQLHGSTVALTGLRFFYMTRGLVLSVAGTIVTYELVLLQFDEAKTNNN